MEPGACVSCPFKASKGRSGKVGNNHAPAAGAGRGTEARDGDVELGYLHEVDEEDGEIEMRLICWMEFAGQRWKKWEKTDYSIDDKLKASYHYVSLL
jgi:hypothetical protein